MSQSLADSVRGNLVGAINNAYEFAPWAEFLAANDQNWWRNHPAAYDFSGLKYSANQIKGVQQIHGSNVVRNSNSGVLGLECAKQLGATRIFLLGFDMRGTHFFGSYTNGCGNTSSNTRELHKKQFWQWGRSNKNISVINCTPSSALECFPAGDIRRYIDDSLAESEAPGIQSG